jgi:hypothetical protein
VVVVAELLVVVPTRERPHNARSLLAALRDTCTADTAVVLSVDASDPAIEEYRTAVIEHQGAGALSVAVGVVDPPAGHVGAINAVAVQAATVWADRPYAVVKLDDDHCPRTYGWDTEYLKALREPGVGIVYGDDLLQGQRLPTAPGMRTSLVAALGWMGPPVLRHLYVDNAWLALGEAAGCLRYLPHVVVEHRHPLAGKAAWDAGYERANAQAQYAADGGAYAVWMRDGLAAAVGVVRAQLLDGFASASKGD